MIFCVNVVIYTFSTVGEMYDTFTENGFLNIFKV